MTTEFTCRVCKTVQCLVAPADGTGGICPGCCEQEEDGHDFSERSQGWIWCVHCGQPASEEFMADRAQD